MSARLNVLHRCTGAVPHAHNHAEVSVRDSQIVMLLEFGKDRSLRFRHSATHACR